MYATRMFISGGCVLNNPVTNPYLGRILNLPKFGPVDF